MVQNYEGTNLLLLGKLGIPLVLVPCKVLNLGCQQPDQYDVCYRLPYQHPIQVGTAKTKRRERRGGEEETEKRREGGRGAEEEE